MSTASANPFADAASNSLEVYLLGCVDYDSALFLQERLVYEISGRDDALGGLLLCEHPPLITIGREGSRADVRADEHELKARQIDVRWVNRGGGCLVHAPGQLAVYPILPLDRIDVSLSDYRRIVEDAIISVSGELKVRAWREPSAPGVSARLGQYAWIGAAVRSWVSWQGAFINVSPDREIMELVDSSPNGPQATSLAAQRTRVTPMSKVREGLIRRLSEGFAYQRFHIYTGHPLLTRTRRRVHVSA